MDYKNNKDDFFDSSLPLDDIDEFFFKNFNVLLDEKEINKKEEIDVNNQKDGVTPTEILDFEINTDENKNDKDKLNIEVLDFDAKEDEIKPSERIAEVLDFDSLDKTFNNLDKKDNIEILDDLNLPKEASPIEMLDFDIPNEAKVENKNIDDGNNVFYNFLDNKKDDNKVEVLDDFLLESQNNNENAFTFDNNNTLNAPYEILEKQEFNPYNNVFDHNDSEKIENATYYKVNTKKVQKKKIEKMILFCILIIILICLGFVLNKIVKWKLDNDSINKQVQNVQNEAIIEAVEDNENTIIVNPEVPTENDDGNENENKEEVNDDYHAFINTPLMSVNIDNLKEKNSDTIGWLKVNGTNINYPVVQTTNNSFYLTHSFDKKRNEGGWLFADYRNNLIDDKNLIIYGHARLNSTMFGTLRYTTKSFWYTNSSNHLIKLSTTNFNSSWQVFSTYIIENENYYIQTYFNNDGEYLNFLNTLKARSVYNYGVNINENDKILTLSTCHTNNRRVVLHAKLIKMEKR